MKPTKKPQNQFNVAQCLTLLVFCLGIWAKGSKQKCHITCLLWASGSTLPERTHVRNIKNCMGWAAPNMAREQRHVKNHSIAAAAVPAVPAAAVAAAAIAACAVGTASASAAASAPASVAAAVAAAAAAAAASAVVCLLTSYCLKTLSTRLVSKQEIPDVVLTQFHHMGKRLHGQLLVLSIVRWATGSALARCTNVIQL